MSARLIGRTGPTAGQDYVLMDVATIGASADNEIRIVAPGVSRRHARVVKDKGQYFLEDARATNGTFLNGDRVEREALQHLDVITLGRAVDLIFLRRETDTPAPLSDQITNARLQVLDGAEAGTVIEVAKGELMIGRAPSCNVVLASGLISKVHARIQRTANQVVLQDLQSINGTFVNGVRVDSVVVLKNGDTINFAGARSLSIGIEGAAASTKPALADQPAFNQEWKTRFVWAPDELALLEQARAEAMELAAVRAPAAEPPVGKKAAAAPKPAPPAPPKAAGAQAKPNVAGAVKQPPPVVAPKAEPGVPPAPAAKAAVPPPGTPPAAASQAPAAAVKPAGPAQAAVQAAAAPIKPGSPVPVKPDPAAAVPPAVPAAASAPKPAEPRGEVETHPLGAVRPSLRGIRLVGPGEPIALGIGTFVVGRALGADVRLDDRQVSRSHARIIVEEIAATIEDLQTVNGTLVNGKEVKARQSLAPGDTVQFGASAFKVELTTS